VTLLQALRYFLRTSAVNLVRSWKVSLLAILTIAVSLFVSGIFLLMSHNLASVLERWRGETKVVIYLDPTASPEDLEGLRDQVSSASWVTGIEEVSAEAAEGRFKEVFPSLSDLFEGQQTGTPALPASWEVAFRSQEIAEAASGAFDGWVASLRESPATSMVDDDRDWLRQLQAVIGLLRVLGLALGVVLVGGAIFTIASIIRLTAYLYHDEISIMRLVGATEFFIRGPFYMEGLLQGLMGGSVAAASLAAAYQAVARQGHESLLTSLVAAEFLTWQQITGLVVVGAAAGLVGAVMSLRRESLGTPTEA
jgi:cell division transport system permease protein